MEKSSESDIISEKSLLLLPFSLYNGNIKLPMEEIYSKSKGYTSNLSGFDIGKQKFDIIFEIIDENECKMKLYIGNEYKFIYKLLYKPITLDIKDLDLSIKNIVIYSELQMQMIIYRYKFKYNFVDSNNQILNENKEYKTIKSVRIIIKKIYDIDSQIFKDTIVDYNNLPELQTSKVIKINPLLLSYNFFHIFPDNIGLETKFSLIINEERKKFIEKINNFVESDKTFLWIIGSDGIGKSISLMYYSINKKENVLYFNLKLFDEKNNNSMEYFANEIIKYFFLKKRNADSVVLNGNKSKATYVLNNIFGAQDPKENSIEKFWKSMSVLIGLISMLNIKKQLIIIIDQYRDISSDSKFIKLKDFFQLIKKYKHKIILSASINNKNIQSIFFNDIENFSFYSDNDDTEIKDFEIIDIKNDIYEVKQISDYYEKILRDDEKQFINNNIKKSEDDPFVSLNDNLKDVTEKLYFPSLVSGKELSKDFTDEEIKCFKDFDYNLKYINKYISFKDGYIRKKNKEKKNENKNSKELVEIPILLHTNDGLKKEKEAQKEQDISINQNNHLLNDNNCEINKIEIEKIIENFYLYCRDHIISKIEGFYSSLNNLENPTSFEYQKLKELKENIYIGKSFTLLDLRKIIPFFPGKYLKIYMLKNNVAKSKKKDIIIHYYIDYSNRFIKYTIDYLLKKLDNEVDFLYDEIRGSGAGSIFEKKVINEILKNSQPIFGQFNYESRRVFALIGKTNNSKYTVEIHREEEKNNYLFKFYNINEYTKKIDDIDFDINDKEIKLTNNLFLIKQVSKNGRTFDFAILYRIKESNEWYLYLFQVTINKNTELKEKKEYIKESKKAQKYLSKLYGIEIKKRFLIFIVPYNTNNTDFINALENRKIYYIFYKCKQFYNKSGFIVGNLNFPEAQLTGENNIDDIDEDLYDIYKSLNAWNDSITQFIKRKRRSEKLYKFYNKNLTYIDGKGLNLNLPSEIKNEIGKIISNKLLEGSFDFLFVGNCKCKNIELIYDKTKLIIFFVFENINYFYYGSYYKYENGKFMISKAKPKFKSRILERPNFDKMTIDLSDIKKNINLCFCYSFLRE